MRRLALAAMLVAVAFAGGYVVRTETTSAGGPKRQAVPEGFGTYAAPPTGAGINGERTSWSGALRAWHVDEQAPARVEILHRDTGCCLHNDDTKTVTFTDVNGNQETTHSSAWASLSVAGLVPKRAKAVRLTVKGVITKGSSDGTTTVYVFVRRAGSRCCAGPASAPQYPVDFGLADGRQVTAAMHVALQHAVDGERDFTTVDVPLVNGKFQWAWGYRRVEGEWPAGDAVAFSMFLTGWAE